MRHALTLLVTLAAAPLTAAPATFYKDILPVLQERCQSCHRAGEIGPMAFTDDYASVRPWARAIRLAVAKKSMPPWGADPAINKFHNDPSLTPAETATLVSWADAGAPEGNRADAPAPKNYAEGWQIGTPDVVFEMPGEYEIPARGTLEYIYFVLPTRFTEDRWVRFAEVRPGNRAVVHHVIAFIRERGSKWLSDAVPGEPFIPKDKRDSAGGGNDGRPDDWITGYAPGTPAVALRPGQGKLIKAGSDIVLQVHYTANGTAARDLTRVGMIFSKVPVTERITLAAAQTDKFVIPPGAASHRVDASITTAAPVRITNFQPHMHVRGKAFAMRAVLPDGTIKPLLNVPRYNFRWQHVYELEQPFLAPPGTRIEATAWYDNSANNPDNPNPKAAVRWGDQSWEEMMIGFFDISINPDADRSKLFQQPEERKKKPARRPPSSAE